MKKKKRPRCWHFTETEYRRNGKIQKGRVVPNLPILSFSVPTWCPVPQSQAFEPTPSQWGRDLSTGGLFRRCQADRGTLQRRQALRVPQRATASCAHVPHPLNPPATNHKNHLQNAQPTTRFSAGLARPSRRTCITWPISASQDRRLCSQPLHLETQAAARGGSASPD